jgi:hypothetical protein
MNNLEEGSMTKTWMLTVLVLLFSIRTGFAVPVVKKSISPDGTSMDACGLKDGGFAYLVFAGVIEQPMPNPPRRQIVIHNYDAAGNLRWSKAIPHQEWQQLGYSIIQTRDGGFGITGLMGSRDDIDSAFFIKTDSLGNVVFLKTFNHDEGHGNVYIAFHDLAETPDSGLVLVGEMLHLGSRYVKALRLDKAGNTLWEHLYLADLGSNASSVKVAPDGGVIIAGETATSDTGSNAALLKLDSLGNALWFKEYPFGFQKHPRLEC